MACGREHSILGADCCVGPARANRCGAVAPVAGECVDVSLKENVRCERAKMAFFWLSGSRRDRRSRETLLWGEAREKTRRGARAFLSLLFLRFHPFYGSEVVHFFTFSVDGPRSGRVCVGAGVGREGGARGARLWRVGRRGRGRGRRRTPAASDLQTKGRGGARQGSAAGKAAGLHLGQGGHGRLVEVGAHRSTPRATRRAVTAEIRPTRDGVLVCFVGPGGAGAAREKYQI